MTLSHLLMTMRVGNASHRYNSSDTSISSNASTLKYPPRQLNFSKRATSGCALTNFPFRNQPIESP